ncbi:DUF6290 family protein [Orbus wheelerorum]|uniref:type II toxin-antitoxin system RelB family antitoxin n=1 Tax=Orbus wheelerorum TaxID=3074111 RepID=UPI00370D4A30
MTQLTLRVNAEDKSLITSYAKFRGLSTSELLRTSVLEVIDNDIDCKLYIESVAILNDENDREISFDEMVENLGFKENG